MSAMRSRNDWGLIKNLIYYSAIFIVLVVVAMVYRLWLNNYNMLHPEVVQAVAMGYVEELPLEGLLIWDEQVLDTPKEGILTYPSPLPRRVAKGEPLAAVDGVAVKAGSPGYFIPALDGQEGNWVYSRLWSGFADFPAFGPALPLRNGEYLGKGIPFGKLIPQPQDLRCIAYLDRTPSLERDLKRGFIEIKTEPNGKARRAAIRTTFSEGQKIRVYLTLPFFPPSVLTSRAFVCSVLTGDRQGVSVPDTAVVLRDGKLGVLMVQGSVTEFIEIDGFPASEGSFFVTKGVLPGNVVVLHADKVREGAVRLW